MKITLEMSEQQAQTMLEALDLYSRVGCGQFGPVAEVVTTHWPNRWDQHGLAEHGLRLAKGALFTEFHLAPGTNYSIPNREVPLTFRRAHDVYAHVRQAVAVAKDPNPEFRDVRYDGAVLNVSDEPLPTVTVSK